MKHSKHDIFAEIFAVTLDIMFYMNSRHSCCILSSVVRKPYGFQHQLLTLGDLDPYHDCLLFISIVRPSATMILTAHDKLFLLLSTRKDINYMRNLIIERMYAAWSCCRN